MFDFPEPVLVVLLYQQFVTMERVELTHRFLDLHSNVLPLSYTLPEDNFGLQKCLVRNNASSFIDEIESFFNCRLSAQKYN